MDVTKERTMLVDFETKVVRKGNGSRKEKDIQRLKKEKGFCVYERVVRDKKETGPKKGRSGGKEGNFPCTLKGENDHRTQGGELNSPR